MNGYRHLAGTHVQSSGGFWYSQDLPYTITGDGVTTATTEVYVKTCSVVEGGKYGCVERLPVGSRAYTNTAFDVVFTDVGELKTHITPLSDPRLQWPGR